MAWIRDSNLTWFQRIATNVIKSDRVPRHIAFIMDGNRRFAKTNDLPDVSEGHLRGFDKLADVLRWCMDLGVSVITFYMFSIENYKRDNQELVKLFGIALQKFKQLLEEIDELNENGVRVQFIGNWSLCPGDAQHDIAKAMLLTQKNERFILNISFAYTARDEMTNAVATICRAVECHELSPGDITDSLIRKCMYTCDSPDPDLIIRTSGESRLSDFLLWQVSFVR